MCFSPEVPRTPLKDSNSLCGASGRCSQCELTSNCGLSEYSSWKQDSRFRSDTNRYWKKRSGKGQPEWSDAERTESLRKWLATHLQSFRGADGQGVGDQQGHVLLLHDVNAGDWNDDLQESGGGQAQIRVLLGLQRLLLQSTYRLNIWLTDRLVMTVF